MFLRSAAVCACTSVSDQRYGWGEGMRERDAYDDVSTSNDARGIFKTIYMVDAHDSTRETLLVPISDGRTQQQRMRPWSLGTWDHDVARERVDHSLLVPRNIMVRRATIWS